jgi:hypothetical protein
VLTAQRLPLLHDVEESLSRHDIENTTADRAGDIHILLGAIFLDWSGNRFAA